MKITRGKAIEMYGVLGSMALGKMEDSLLEVTLTNISALRKVSEDFDALAKELFKRLYGDGEKMSDAEKAKINAFFQMLAKVNDAETEEACKKAYPELYALRVKEVKALRSLQEKEVEIALEFVDEKAFMSGILKSNDQAKIHEIRAIFAPLFEKQVKETDLSELDELLK